MGVGIGSEGIESHQPYANRGRIAEVYANLGWFGMPPAQTYANLGYPREG